MVLGNAGKKIGTIVELAEELYEKVTELKEQLAETRETVEATNRRVAELEREAARQRALIEALAKERGIDVDAVLDGAAVEVEAESENENEVGAATED